MNKLDKLSLEIENMRQEMYGLIEKEVNIIAPEIIITSQKIDKLIVKYNIMKNKTL